ncbi:exonuclease domain-containing protein [Mycolicibacillus parakoreensis]|uniref:Exonuclease domain-containing protein n=1 Tax=Mycolicibacillus parakoreensis TaxID=1069221 RepID=A0ABY3U1K6_9MYCO|nr:exonuclease domain-containing protein [Mycolicibacillus parakoreensis]ULN53029.1 exonuclease domain-containing protein [Mycolicibacillus parakoreensis]
MSFAVIDFETTGFVPERSDRVVEVGIVLTDGNGRIEDEWTTLVNPNRDVSAGRIHRITAGDLLDAPDFADISGHVLDRLTGRVVVAHNAPFDMRFLYYELLRADYAIFDRPAALCSMKWAGRMIGTAKLEHCCEALGIPLDDAHSAICDARATAQLLPHLLTACSGAAEWLSDVQRSAAYRWPAPNGCPSHGAPVLRGQVSSVADEWLPTVLQAAWVPGNPEDEAAYLLMLESALLDRSISRTEGRQLVDTAEAARLSSATVRRLHLDYLRSVAVEALDDGVVTETERRDLNAMAESLGMPPEQVDEALAWAAGHTESVPRSSEFALRPGDRVVFTGETDRDRGEWIATVVAAGLTSGGVTKSTRLVVAADPDSLSRKATKARSYGIPIVSEAAFDRLFHRYLHDD